MVENTSSHDQKRKGASLSKTSHNATHERWSSVHKGSIESDERVSKSNHGSSLWHLIEDTILDKILVFDNSVETENHEIYAITDLQACFYRKLYKIRSILKESIGVETKSIQLMNKTLPIMEHRVSTVFGTRKEFHGGRRSILAGKVQGNVVSVNMWRDLSLTTLKDVETKKT